MEEPAARRVVVTGAAGRIGRAVTPLLAGRFDLGLTDLRAGDGVAALDVTDVAACARAFAAADAVVHLAGNPDPDGTWDALLAPNVVGAHAVAAAAMTAGVRRLVLASSLHAVSARPPEVQARNQDQARPANLYGATKAWAEALGSWVATTSATSVVALRIGYFAPERPDPAACAPTDRAAWLSPRDAAELIRVAVETDVNGFIVVGGVSANRFPKAELAETARLIGYRPVDDAWA